MTSVEATCSTTSTWTLNRILFLIAGTVTLLGTLAGAFLSPWFLLLPGMAGANQLLLVATGWCPMSLLLTRCGVGNTAS